MVRKTILEVVANKGSQWVVAVLTLTLHHIWAREDVAVELTLCCTNELKRACRACSKVLRDDNIVKQIPRVTVAKCTITCLEQSDIWVVEVAINELFDVALSTESLGNALVSCIVVKVTHNYNLCVWICYAYRVCNATALRSCCITLWIRRLLTTKARWPVRNKEEEWLALNCTPHSHQITGIEVRHTRHLKLMSLAALNLKDIRTIEECAVYTTTIWRVIVHDTIVAEAHLWLSNQILKYKAVLNLRNTDNRRKLAVDSGHIKEYLVDIALLFVILRAVPLLNAGRQKLIVVFVRVVNCVKQVLKVVEDNHMRLLCKTTKQYACDEQCC